jgi:SAM-dependent methyltransferase
MNFSLHYMSRRALVPALVVLFSAAAAAQTVQRDVPYVPTPMETVKRMLELADVKKGEYMMDLGSGDGRIAIMAAKDYGAKAVGIDIDPQRIKEANENAKKEGVADRVEFIQANLFEYPIKDANVITMYLLTSVNAKLRPRLLDELRPGTRLVSHAFDMGDWEAEVHDQSTGRSVYLWIVPAKVEGHWAVKDGERSFAIDIKQQFQMLSGNATIGGKSIPLANAKMRGSEIVFTLNVDGKPQTFHGKVSGDRMEATAGPTATQKNWSAARAAKG